MAHIGRSIPPWPMVRIFKHTSAPSFEIGGLTLGVAAFRILGLGWAHCLNNGMFFSWIICLMAPSSEASNYSSCSLFHVKSVWKIKHMDFQDSLELPSKTILFLFYYFYSHLCPLYCFPDPHTSTLIGGIFVEDGL